MDPLEAPQQPASTAPEAGAQQEANGWLLARRAEEARDRAATQQFALLQRRLFQAQSEALLQCIKRQQELTGVNPLAGVHKETNVRSAGELASAGEKFSRRDIPDDVDRALRAEFSLRDWLSREDYRSLALRLNSTEFTVRSAFQLLRARLRKSLAKASGTVVRKHSLAAPTQPPSSTEVLLQSIAASRQHDQGLSQQLQLLVSPASQGGLAQASFAPLLVALMTSARTPALKATLAEVAAASGGCSGAPQALAEAGALAAVAGWLVEAERDGHTTLLRKYLATARALPVSSAAQAGVLARPLQKCRGYALAQDVGEQATQLLVHWSRALGPLGHAVAGPPAAPAAMLPLQPFIGPPMSRSGIQALATRLAQPSLVTMRSAEDRLAGVNERAAARPLSVDELLKKKRLAAQSAGGLLAPGYKRPRAGAATPALPAHLRQQQPQPHAQPPTQIQWAPPPMVSVADCDYGVDSHEVAIQMARQADTPPVCYLLASLVPDDPATPLEVEAEARAAEGVPVPFIPDMPADPEDAERQRAKAGLLLQPQPGWTWPPWGGLAPPPTGS